MGLKMLIIIFIYIGFLDVWKNLCLLVWSGGSAIAGHIISLVGILMGFCYFYIEIVSNRRGE